MVKLQYTSIVGKQDCLVTRNDTPQITANDTFSIWIWPPDLLTSHISAYVQEYLDDL